MGVLLDSELLGLGSITAFFIVAALQAELYDMMCIACMRGQRITRSKYAAYKRCMQLVDPDYRTIVR